MENIYFSTLVYIQAINFYFKRYIDPWFLLWPSILSFDKFITCVVLDNFYPSILFAFEKAEIILNQW